MATAFQLERIAQTKALIVAYEDAILAITAGGASEYTLNTGATSQRVTKLNINTMNSTLDTLLNRLRAQESRAGLRSPITVIRPGF